MKKFLSVILIIYIIFSLSACYKQKKETGSQLNSPEITTNKNLLQEDENTSDCYDKKLYIDVTPAELTDSQAKELMSAIVPKQFEIFNLFGEWDDNTLDHSQVCSFDENYVLLTDERFTCVQDIRNYVLDVMTEEAAKKLYFNHYLDGPYNPVNGDVNKYIDYDGKLYRSLHSGGKGFNYKLLPETSHIIERTEHSVKIEMNTLYSFGTNDGWMYTPTLVKTQQGWRINSSLDEGYYRD